LTQVVLIVAANGIARVYAGAHWPTDIVGGILIATSWLVLQVAINSVVSRLFTASPERQPAPTASGSHVRPAEPDAG
jgi:membrane-associated phospholipid phosphatase